jgi:hypothetical protein
MIDEIYNWFTEGFDTTLCVANCRFCRNLQFATAASIPPLGLTHPVCGQYLRFAFWKSVQPTACFVRLASKGPEPA